MQQLTRAQEILVNEIIAREFIEEKLGIEATSENISIFVAYIISYEEAVEKRKHLKRSVSTIQRLHFLKHILAF